MKIIAHENEIEIAGISDFDLAKTFECGQCFRWNADENGIYTGIAFGLAAKVRRRGGSIFISGSLENFNKIWRNYFDLDRDYAKIRKQLCVDGFMRQATDFGTGIRILKQDKWEVLCSFITSQNNNIPRIKSIIDTLCREFGNAVWFEEKQLYTFPSAETLEKVEAHHLAPLRCGYRAEYIIRTARAIANGTIDLDALSQNSPDAARTALKKLHGVGDKVADCVMLFGLHKLDAFPIDVWMKRAVAQHYGTDFDPVIFSPYAGIAQQYIFHYMREKQTTPADVKKDCN